VAGTSSGSITHSTVGVGSKTVVNQYYEDYLSFGFISSGEEQLSPKCIVCGEKLTKLKKQAMPLPKSWQKRLNHMQFLSQ
jgi:hypothetical protein